MILRNGRTTKQTHVHYASKLQVTSFTFAKKYSVLATCLEAIF